MDDETDIGIWIGPVDRPLAARLWAPELGDSRSGVTPGSSTSGVVLLPPVGYQYWTSYPTLRALAETLAGSGHVVLRVDFEGTGDSSGEQTEPGRWPAWNASVDHAVAELRRRGVERVTAVGLRLGGTLALLRGAALELDAVVAVQPIVSGRRYVRELALLGSPSEPAADVEPGTILQAGTVFPPDLVSSLSAIDLTRLEARPAERALVLEPAGRPAAAPLLDRLYELGVDASRELAVGFDEALERPAEEAAVATEMVVRISTWLGRCAPGAAAETTPCRVRHRARIRWQEGIVEEEFVRVGASRLAGVLSRPERDAIATVVLLNSGSEVHVGPGRAWVEYARALARHGFETLRVDFRGWGDSSGDGHAPGRPYDRHTSDDTAEIVADLRRRGRERIVLLGLCAGAWVALKAATRLDIEGVVAINPQLYWQPGDPVEALLSDTRQRRLGEIERFKRHGGELERTEPHPAGAWLVELRDTGTPVLTLFARGDDGLEFLLDRLPVTWRETLESGFLRAVTLDIDHPMHRHWRRPAVVSEILDFLVEQFSAQVAAERPMS